jgi:hypothetical protein
LPSSALISTRNLQFTRSLSSAGDLSGIVLQATPAHRSPSLKRKTKAAIAALLLVGVLWLNRHCAAENLLRIPLAAGGEFRVLKIYYGGPDGHHLGGPPSALLRFRRHLPDSLQRFIPYSGEGISGISPAQGHTMISIWWAYIHPKTGNPELGPSGDVIMTVDSGEDTNLGWPYPADDYRQIYVIDPPTDSRKLHFLVTVEDETVEFTIANPAYDK